MPHILPPVPIDQEAIRVAVVDYLFRTLWALVVVIVAIAVARGTRGTAVRMLSRKRADPNVIVLLGNLAQLLVFVLGGLVVVAIYTRDAFGWILTSFSVLGLVVGLSLQDILKNFFAGVYILVERPFRIGDTVQVAGEEGAVEEISFRTTRLRTADGREVVVPNGTLMTEPVVNLTRFPSRSAKVSVAIPAAELSPEVSDRLRDALSRAEHVDEDPAPRVALRGVEGGTARFEVTVWGRDREAAAEAAISAITAASPGWEVRFG